MLNPYLLIGYGVFLLLMLIINLLYLFQVFRYRLPGDASLIVVAIHLGLLFTVLTVSTLWLI